MSDLTNKPKPNMREKIDEIKSLMLDLSENWDHEQIVHYPAELPSFDELLNLFLGIECK